MDPGNILSILNFLGQGAPGIASAQSMSGQMPADEPITYTPVSQPEAPISNVLQSVAPSQADISSQIVNMPSPVQAPQTALAAQPVESPKKRRSVLETIGRLADVFAQVGGAQPLYQSTLNARQDQTNQIDLDAMRKQLLQQQVQAGAAAPQDAVRARIGQALGAFAGNPELLAQAPQVFEQLGIPQEQASQIFGLIQQNPALAGPLAQAMGFEPAKQGSLPAAIQNYQIYRQILETQGQAAADEFLRFAATPGDNVKTLDLGGSTAIIDPRGNVKKVLPRTERPGFSGGRPTAPAPTPSGKAATKADPVQLAASAAPIVADLRDAITRLHNSGGMTDEKSGLSGVISATARENLPFYERVTNPEGFSARQDLDRLLTVGIPALLPLMGGLQLGGKNIDAAKELETWRKAIASAKDYPSAIRAIEGFERRIQELKTPGTTTPVKPAGKSGWSVVGVK